MTDLALEDAELLVKSRIRDDDELQHLSATSPHFHMATVLLSAEVATVLEVAGERLPTSEAHAIAAAYTGKRLAAAAEDARKAQEAEKLAAERAYRHLMREWL